MRWGVVSGHLRHGAHGVPGKDSIANALPPPRSGGPSREGLARREEPCEDRREMDFAEAEPPLRRTARLRAERWARPASPRCSVQRAQRPVGHCRFGRSAEHRPTANAGTQWPATTLQSMRLTRSPACQACRSSQAERGATSPGSGDDNPRRALTDHMKAGRPQRHTTPLATAQLAMSSGKPSTS